METELSEQEFPIVALGGSAGGMFPIADMLSALDPQIGMGFVVIMHLPAESKSNLTEILSRMTTMPVSEARDGTIIEENSVYVMLPGTDLTVAGGVLHASVRTAPPGHHKPIDQFFHSLAENSRSLAVGIIFSGGDGDGSEGCRSIHSRGGQVYVQDPKNARHDSMPESALEKGCVDFMGSPDELAAELSRSLIS